jgi:AraC-like DNA-binding protein
MDPLSDLLRAVRLTGAHFFQSSASGTWGMEAAPAGELSPRILPASEHLIAYHLVLTGRCWGGMSGTSPVPLEAGDVILFPHGDGHVMCSGPEPGAAVMPVHTVPRFPRSTGIGDPENAEVTLVCGFFGCDRQPFNPLCAALPRQLQMRGLSEGVVGIFARQVVQETTDRRAGSESMLTRLAELMFIEVLRRYLDAASDDAGGWLAGLRDPLVGRALALLHAEPGRRWALTDLAREAASSRSSLTERFTQLVGMPPMQYLTRWRMQLAAGRLRESSAKVAAIASEVGYDSEAAFSRAFKKATGSSPTTFRRRDASRIESGR